MIKIENNTSLTLENLNTGRKLVFKNKESLTRYIRQHYIKHLVWLPEEKKYNNIILDGFNATGKDRGTYLIEGSMYWEKNIYNDGLKPYICYDAYGARVDIRKYFDWHNKAKDMYLEKRWNYKSHKWLRQKDSGYRREPVARTGMKRRRWDFYRDIRFAQQLRELTIPEYREFTRKGVLEKLPDPWMDEPVKHFEKNWKKQYKVRKQWMIHREGTKKRIKTSEIEDINIDLLLAEDFENAA